MGRFTSWELLDRRTTSFDPRDARDAFELLEMCVTGLQDTSQFTREKALVALAGALEELPRLDELDNRCYNVFALCGICIKEGSRKEERLAYRAAGLLALAVRAGAPGYLASSFPLLSQTIARNRQSDAPTVAAALDCLAAVTVAGARGRDDVERSVKAVWDLVSASTGTSPKALAAAVSTWTFLVTTVVSVTDALRKADGAVWNATFSSLVGLLDNEDRAVRLAAGEALAVCVELNRTQHTPRRDMDALRAKVSSLASESPAKKGSKSNNTLLPQQRDLFRRIAAFLDRGERLEESVPTAADRCVALKVSTWAKLVQLNFLRRFLGDGFVKHVQGNELLVEAFSYGADEGKVLSIANKKRSSNTEDKDLKVVPDSRWDWSIFCDYPYTARHKPGTLLKIGWQALN